MTHDAGPGSAPPAAPVAPVEPVLRVEGLEKAYGELKAVQGLTFQVAPGEVLGLVGPNGAGKTSTLRCLAGILPVSGGRVAVAGHDVAAEPVKAKQALAFLPDEPRLFDYLTVWEHLNFVARLYGVERWEEKGRALLAEMELVGKEKSLPGELSRGMKQKLSIACGFLHDPRLILLDEPLTGLDPIGIRRMKASLRRRSEQGAAMVLSSHLLPLVEELCHRILVIAGGRAVALGTLEEIRSHMSGMDASNASLEELFVRITGAGGEPPEPPAT